MSRISKQLREAVLRRDGYRCVKCGRTGHTLTCDHIKPRSHGGSEVISNLQILCHSCNSRRGNRAPHVGRRYAR